MQDPPQVGNVYEDSIYGNKLRVKFSDEEVVLVKEVGCEEHHLYSRKDFDTARELSLNQTQNRFTLVKNASE